MKIKLPKNVYSTISYRGIVRDALREDGQEHEGDMFFIGSFDKDMDGCIELAKEYNVETIWTDPE